MRIVLGFLVSLLFAASFCHGDHVEVVGVAECADCAETNFKPTHAVKGLKVNIDCKAPNGENFKTRGFGELDGEGNFKVSLPEELVEDGKLKEECYAQLQSASATPCPAHDGLDSTKLVVKSRSEDGHKHVFGVSGKLRFSPTLCASAFFWHHYYKHPPLPKVTFPPYHHHPLPKIFPPFHKKPYSPPVPVVSHPPPVPVVSHPPPVPVVTKPHPPPVPVVKKPCPPPVPVYKKPHPPPVPVYKKPHPPPVPVYKKPLPPPVPTKKPCPPVPKIPPIPKKTYPPIPKIPKIPPVPKIPKIPKKPCPPLPKLPPPKFFKHPKFGKFPPPSPHHL